MAKKSDDNNKKTKIEKQSVSPLAVAKKAIIQKYGEGVISLLGDHEDLKIDAISTGCLGLDIALGVGGFARGRLYEVFGPNSAGKSTLALSVVIQALLRDLNVTFIDAEHALDPKLVRKMGEFYGLGNNVVDRINLVQGYTGDDNLEIAEMLMSTNEMDVLVIDSVSALLPKNMAVGEISDNFIAELARLMSRACMKLTPICNRTNTLLIFINQIRHSMDKWKGDVTSGGEALSFYATGRIKTSGGEFASQRIVDNEGVVVGHRSKFEIVKNKLAPPWRRAEVDLLYGKGYDFVAETVDISVQLGIVEKKGAWYKYGNEKIQGRDNVILLFRDDTKLYAEVRNKIKLGLGLNN